MKRNHSAALGLAYVALLAQTGCEHNKFSAPEPKKPRLVFITAGTNLFWKAALPGIEAAARDFRVDFEVVQTESSAMDYSGADGIAFNPINGAVQLAASGGGVCFVGIDHYKAGRIAGELAREVLPRWAKIIILSPARELTFLRDRQQGIIDEVSDGYLVGTESSAEEALRRHPDVGCLIALSPPNLRACLEALCASDKLGQVKVIAFDEDELEAFADGRIYGVVTQQPYEYGYHSVRVLAGLARGDGTVLPRSGFLEIPIVVLRHETASHTAARALH